MIAWFCKNGVAANLLMLLIMCAGIVTVIHKIPVEVFPDFASDNVAVRVPFRGATPEEVEDGVLLRIEEAIFDLEGIKKITSTAKENIGTVNVEVEKGYDPRDFLDDLKNRVDAISTFPEDTERPVFRIATRKREVISVVVAADIPEIELRRLGETVRDDIIAIPGITQVDLSAVRNYEISIEIPEETLDRYNLTFTDVANAIRQSSLDLSAGRIRTPGGEVLLRTKGQAYTGEDLQSVIIKESSDGHRITLADIATIRDSFEEEPIHAEFNGKPCVFINVDRVGDQSAIEVSNGVKDYIAKKQIELGDNVELTYWRDRSKIVRSRLKTLAVNAIQGGILVFILLALFLRFSVAGWVCLGIPVSMLGALILMPILGATINIFTLFAFILVLGIVVDDAIVTGENIYRHLRIGDYHGVEAAIKGTQEVTVPVVFGVLTTIVAFVPILMMDSGFAKAFAQIPLVVIPVLLFSLVESKLILPAHLRHLTPQENPKNPLVRVQQWIAHRLEDLIRILYTPVLRAAIRWRYLVLAIFVAGAAVIIALRPSGRLHFVFIPRVPHEVISAHVTMPIGTPVEVTEARINQIRDAAAQLALNHPHADSGHSIVKHAMLIVGASRGLKGSHYGHVQFELMAPEDRVDGISNQELVKEWRGLIGDLPGIREISFRSEIMQGSSPVNVQLEGNNLPQLAAAAAEVRTALSKFDGVFDVTDSFQEGKQEIRLATKPQGELLGITTRNLATQVRQAFFGEEAQRVQRGRDDVRIMVRYPEEDRRSIGDLEGMRIRTPDGRKVPIAEVAELTPSKSSATIRRVDRKRTVNVTADINKEQVDMEILMASLTPQIQKILTNYPEVYFDLEGEERERRESFATMKQGMIIVLLVIYALLAIPFKSYLQPFIVMSAIPFGVASAFLGHVVLGHSLSLLSFFGILALTGVVVNDSLVLVDYINKRRKEGISLTDAVATAGSHRFRPILLTSLTTFVGLMPLIFFEKSTQAQFLIPMAVSLGFGILFTTFTTLLLVPSVYLVLEDGYAFWRWFWSDKTWAEAKAQADDVNL